MSEIRFNMLTGEWVVIAPERARKPESFAEARSTVVIPEHLGTCIFCPGNEAQTTEEKARRTDEAGAWQLRSVVNKFSVLSPVGDVVNHQDGFQNSISGVGLHEVLIDCPRHDLSLGQLGLAHVEMLLEAYQERFTAFYADPRIAHVTLFKNHGSDAGASQAHPHSQLVGTPMVPGQVTERVERSRRFHAETGKCLSCWIIENEQRDGRRLIASDDAFVAFIPYAALSPFHTWIFPKAHAASFATLSPSGVKQLAAMVSKVLGRVYAGLGNPAFNLVFRSLSPKDTGAPHLHWYVSLVPRLSKAAGFELGTGMYVNAASPEHNAAFLRDLGDRPGAT